MGRGLSESQRVCSPGRGRGKGEALRLECLSACPSGTAHGTLEGLDTWAHALRPASCSEALSSLTRQSCPLLKGQWDPGTPTGMLVTPPWLFETR